MQTRRIKTCMLVGEKVICACLFTHVEYFQISYLNKVNNAVILEVTYEEKHDEKTETEV